VVEREDGGGCNDYAESVANPVSVCSEDAAGCLGRPHQRLIVARGQMKNGRRTAQRERQREAKQYGEQESGGGSHG